MATEETSVSDKQATRAQLWSSRQVVACRRRQVLEVGSLLSSPSRPRWTSSGSDATRAAPMEGTRKLFDLFLHVLSLAVSPNRGDVSHPSALWLRKTVHQRRETGEGGHLATAVGCHSKPNGCWLVEGSERLAI